MLNGEVRAQNADPERMQCRDCIYRDKDTMEIEGKLIQTGVMRGRCLVFDGKRGRWKPNGVYFNGEPCIMYEQDETAPKFWEEKK